jgi:predicted nucleotidyltransferase
MMKTIQSAQGIGARDREVFRELKERVQQFAPSSALLLYGSVARGSGGPESGYDVLIG